MNIHIDNNININITQTYINDTKTLTWDNIKKQHDINNINMNII